MIQNPQNYVVSHNYTKMQFMTNFSISDTA